MVISSKRILYRRRGTITNGVLHVEMRMDGASSSMRSARPLVGEECTAGERQVQNRSSVYQALIVNLT